MFLIIKAPARIFLAIVNKEPLPFYLKCFHASRTKKATIHDKRWFTCTVVSKCNMLRHVQVCLIEALTCIYTPKMCDMPFEVSHNDYWNYDYHKKLDFTLWEEKKELSCIQFVMSFPSSLNILLIFVIFSWIIKKPFWVQSSSLISIALSTFV